MARVKVKTSWPNLNDVPLACVIICCKKKKEKEEEEAERKNGSQFVRLKQSNYCSLRLLINTPLRLTRAAYLPKRLHLWLLKVYHSLVGFIYHMIWFSTPSEKPLQWRKRFIVEVVRTVIWYGSSAFTLEDSNCPQCCNWPCQLTYLLIAQGICLLLQLCNAPHTQLLKNQAVSQSYI